MPTKSHTPTTEGAESTRSRRIARIWCLARDLGLTSELLHCAVESITGKSSISTLSIRHLSQVIAMLETRLKQDKRRNWRNGQKHGGNVTFVATPQQRELVQDLLDKLTPALNLHSPEAYLDAVCRRTYRRPFNRLTKAQTQGVIEALKSIYKRSVENETDGNEGPAG
jgi:HPt (histidine-containing phosphotransfer) domain-containing protein